MTILGSYDFSGHNYNLNIYNVPVQYFNVELHELIHATLTTHSTLGALCILLKPQPGIVNPDDRGNTIFNELVSRTREVQEGTATYIEYLYIFSKESQKVFIKNLKSIDTVYKKGFTKARLIEKILSNNRLKDFSQEDRRYLRRCALIDISRFALNLPLISLSKNRQADDIVSTIKLCLTENDPVERWKCVLNSLAQDLNLANQFIERSLPMFRLWIEKYNRPQSIDGKYSGVLLGDNLETILAELFPEIPWEPQQKELKLAGAKIIEGSESYEEYLTRAVGADLHFSAQLPIRLIPDVTPEALMLFIRTFQPGGDQGCYMKIFLNTFDQPRELFLGSNIANLTLPPGQSLVLIHAANFRYLSDGRKIWSYDQNMSAFLFSTSLIATIVDCIESDDCVLAIDFDLGQKTALDMIFDEIRHPGKPIFIYPNQQGSFKSFLSICESEIARYFPLDVFPMQNKSDFSGVDNQSIWTIWLVPRLNVRDVSITLLGTPLLYSYVLDFIKSDEATNLDVHYNLGINDIFFDTASTIFPKNQNIKDRWTLLSDSLWFIDEENIQMLHAPKNGYIVVAHMLSFGI